MSDLSWLNPTPHAIAVYASRPLSPVATQHSLPSGRYSLTWAGLPPAGSRQLCLAHSFDHLVGAHQNCRRDGNAHRPRCLQIDHEVKFGRLLDRQITGSGALQNLVYVNCRSAEIICHIGTKCYEPAIVGVFTFRINRRNSCRYDKFEDIAT